MCTTRIPPSPSPRAAGSTLDPQTIRLLPPGSPFEQGRLYEFTYPAKDPIVAGLGFAATRDLAAFLHHSAADDHGHANPLAGNVQAIYTFGISQPARYMRDFVHLGFNEDEQGRPVFDGILNWIAGASGIFLNYRFADPGERTANTSRGGFRSVSSPLPTRSCSIQSRAKPTDDSGAVCPAARAPEIFEVNSANEYWVKATSLLRPDTRGKDLADPPNVRYYLMSSLPHQAASGPGICAQPRNPVGPNPVLRALLVALDEWVTSSVAPRKAGCRGAQMGHWSLPCPDMSWVFQASRLLITRA